MKKHNVLSLIKGMLSLIGKHTWLIVLAVLVGTLGFFAAMGITFFSGLAIAQYLGMEVAISFVWLIVFILIAGFSRGALRYAEQYLNHYMAFTLLALVRNKVFGALRKQGSKVLDERNKGDILSILQSDTESLEVFYAHTITPFFIALFVETGVMISLALLAGWQFMLIGLGADLLIGFLAPVLFYCSNRKLGKQYRMELARAENTYLNSIYGIRKVVFFQHQKEALKEINGCSQRLNSLSKKLNNKATNATRIVNLLIAMADIGILSVGGYLNATYGIGSPTMVLSYAILAASFGPVVALANLPANLTMSFASAERILNLMEEKLKVIDGTESFVFDSLEVKNVSFAYENENILNGVNLSLKKGEVVGIHGKSGTGKSTLLKLLLHFEEANDGEILYNGKDVASYSRESISKNVVLFSQSTYLFQATYAENLRIAKPDASLEELQEACRKAGILDFILKSPEGFNTLVNDKQDNLSTGEKQRLGLARIFLSGAKFFYWMKQRAMWMPKMRL